MEQFITRLKTFGWLLGAYLVAMGLSWISEHIGLLELNPFWTAFVGLVISQITKWWNSKMNLEGKTFFGRER
jgi:hypothetical protein